MTDVVHEIFISVPCHLDIDVCVSMVTPWLFVPVSLHIIDSRGHRPNEDTQ